MTARCSVRARLFPLLTVLSLLPLGWSGCRGRERATVFVQKRKPPLPNGIFKPPPAAGPHYDDLRYRNFVRPLLTRIGCDSGVCHGESRGGGMFLSEVGGFNLRDYNVILARLDRKDPEKSELVEKMLGRVQHNGGKGIDEKSCDYKRLIAWIGQRPDPDCTDPPPPDQGERFAREVAPALQQLGCADKACHGGGPSTQRFDLSGLQKSPPDGRAAWRQSLNFYGGQFAVWRMPLLRAADAVDKIHTQRPADRLSCAYRRLYGFFSKAPEIHCELAPKAPEPRPSLEVFDAQVSPAMQRRGCLSMACHASGAGGMTLMPSGGDLNMALHDYVNLMARVEDPKHLDDSTLLRTARNQEPHGGGQRLAGKGDCVDDQLVAWLSGKPVAPCPPPVKPSYERFVSEIQPVLDKMTCTSFLCHGRDVPRFILTKDAADPEHLTMNYKNVLKEIDYDYPRMSGIMLRMRTSCSFAITEAWITQKPKPSCVLEAPDPRLFPRVEPKGPPVHPKMTLPMKGIEKG